MQSRPEGINQPIEFMRMAGVILITFTHMRHEFTEGATYFILEVLPTYGTLLLSIISGYLFAVNRDQNILPKKIRSLLIPYLIANLAVLIPVLIINAFGYNYLNRLHYDYTLITEGLFSLHSPPINPPTYFIRDLFLIFCFISLTQKNYWGLFFIVPLLVFGSLFLRWDIVGLFVAGFIIRKYSIDTLNKFMLNGIGIIILAIDIFFNAGSYFKYIIAILFFLNFVNLKISFPRTGAYTYLLHLYHTPVMVAVFPVLHLLHPEPYFEIVAQVMLSIVFAYLLMLFIKQFKLHFISGNRR